MSEVIDVSRVLRESPDLFPWVVLVIVLAFLYRERGVIRELFESIIQSRKEVSIYHAQHNELVRNNTAALENNTAALDMVKKEREMLAKIMDRHEQLSAERFSRHEEMSAERERHIQAVINRIDETARSNGEALMVLEDRTREK